MASSAGAIKAGEAYVEIGTNDSKLAAGLRAAQKRVAAFGAGLTAVGTRLVGIGALLAVPFVGAAKMFASMGSELVDMSDRTGVSVERLSALKYAAEQTGTSIQDLELALKAMVKNGFKVSEFEAIADS